MRDSLQIVQAEWNIVKLGNAAHFGMCKRARLKDLYMEANKSGWFSSKTIPLMTNKIIEVSKKNKNIRTNLAPYFQLVYSVIDGKRVGLHQFFA